MRIVSIKFPQPYQKKTVNAGETKVIYELPITGGYVGFIDKLAIDWYAHTYINFRVDGTTIEKIERRISFASFEVFDPPIIARKSIKFIVVNEDTEEHIMAVLCDGLLSKPLQ